MTLGDSRRRFPRPPAGRRRRLGGAAAWPGVPAGSSRRAQTVGGVLSLSLACVLVAALAYALYKFFGMVSARQMDVRDLWFVPVIMGAVILWIAFRVIRPLLREILTKTSPK